MRGPLLLLFLLTVACGPSTGSNGNDLSMAAHDLAGSRDFSAPAKDLPMACQPLRATCADKAECCLAGADCQLSPSEANCCLPRNADCTDPLDCCGYMACTGNKCVCSDAGSICTYNDECCSGTCANQTCN